MIFNQRKLPFKQSIHEVWVLDKPNATKSGLKDVPKEVWFDRGYGVTKWRKEGTSNWDALIGELADPNGKIHFDLAALKRVWGNTGAKQLQSNIGLMVENGQLREDGVSLSGSNTYQLTLTPERQPSESPEFLRIPLIEYTPTVHCYCSREPGDVMYLGCETCRNLVLSVIKSYYGNYWLEIEEAITKRQDPTEPAEFEISKVPVEDRSMIAESIGKIAYLCSKSMFFKPVDTTRLFWLVGDAQNRIHINPTHFFGHKTRIPDVDRQFIDAHKRDEVAKSGRSNCWNCDAVNPKKNSFCGSCGSRLRN